jgi:7-keto-8-aminopelargonate synthetase-like enzyme
VNAHQERLRLLEDMLNEADGRGLILRTPDDEPLNGRQVSLDGRPRTNFGSCSYLGLELDPRLRAGVCEAVMRYGTQFSSSRTYLSAPPYEELELLLGEVFGGHVLVAPSTSLGHLAALPVIVEPGDGVLVDQQVHHSVQIAVNQLRVQGVEVELVRHSRVDLVEEAIERMRGRCERIWYLADGVYSMYADLAPFDDLAALLERHDQLHLYIDDSHGVGWSGRHGRGPALQRFAGHERVVVAASLNKSFAAAGGALVFPSAALRRRVRLLGGPMIFSGPVQPPMLGAAVASARIHLSPELEERQAALRDRIRLCTDLLDEFCLPLASRDLTPIRFVTLGLPSVAQEVTERLLEDGIYVNLGMFPAVPIKRSGVRITLTLHHEPEDIQMLVEALARHVPAALAAAGAPAADRRAAGAGAAAAPAPATAGLRLERARTIDALDPAEWDRLLGGRGTFSAAGLRSLEQAFAGGRPEDRWDFHYYVVRDAGGSPVLATFFTAALWKDDMLSPAAVSRHVEALRAEDPYHLTSRTFAMGSLLTEGDHLYLDRGADWRGALTLLLDAVGEDAERAGAVTSVVRDLPVADTELGAAICDRGFISVAMPDALTIDPVQADDAGWLAGLSARSRAHQRREVLPWDGAYDVEFLRAGGRTPSVAELDHLHGLYRNVRERALDLNTFELPRTFLSDALQHPCWELMLLRLRPEAGGAAGAPPVAFGAHFVGERHYVPNVVGLDYDHVRAHGAYRQALRQALLRARALGATRMTLGMGATLEKRRFGARAELRCVYVQATDHYASEVLAAIEAQVLAGAVEAIPARRAERAPGPGPGAA